MFSGLSLISRPIVDHEALHGAILSVDVWGIEQPSLLVFDLRAQVSQARGGVASFCQGESTNPQQVGCLLLDMYRITIGLCAPGMPTLRPYIAEEQPILRPSIAVENLVIHRHVGASQPSAPRMPKLRRRHDLRRKLAYVRP